jgi:hypothetical protein
MTSKNQLGVVAESTFGTYVAPTKFVEFTGESLAWNQERIESKAWRAGTRVLSASRWKAGKISVAGNIELEVSTKSFGLFFQHALGTGTITTPGSATARLMAFTLGDLLGKSMTVQVGMEDTAGTVRAFSFKGCKVNTMSLGCATGELLTMSLGIIGQDLDTGQTLGSASYASSPELFSFVEGSLSVGTTGGTVAITAKDWTLEVDNSLSADDYTLGSAKMRQPIEPAMRKVSGTFDSDFVDLVEFNRFKNATESTLTMTFQTTTAIEGVLYPYVKVVANIRYDGDTPTVSGPEQVRQPIKYAVTAPASGEPLTISYQTTDTAY